MSRTFATVRNTARFRSDLRSFRPVRPRLPLAPVQRPEKIANTRRDFVKRHAEHVEKVGHLLQRRDRRLAFRTRPMSRHTRETERVVDVPVRQTRRVLCRTYPRRNLVHLRAVVALLVYRLRHVQRLREPGTVDPVDRVADFEPGVLNRDDHTVIRARPAEREKVSARFQHPETLPPQFDRIRNTGRVPRLPHKPQLIRRIRHDTIHRTVGEIAEPVQTRPDQNPPGSIPNRFSCRFRRLFPFSHTGTRARVRGAYCQKSDSGNDPGHGYTYTRRGRETPRVRSTQNRGRRRRRLSKDSPRRRRRMARRRRVPPGVRRTYQHNRGRVA